MAEAKLGDVSIRRHRQLKGQPHLREGEGEGRGWGVGVGEGEPDM